MIVLGIETSCDECASAVLKIENSKISVLSSAIYSQTEIHAPFGGVVPEVASRNHLETINHIVDQSLQDAKLHSKDLELISVTNRPGLVGALLVGVAAGKSLAYCLDLPLVPVHHLEGHAVSVFLEANQEELAYPSLLCIVSGGHSNLYHMERPPGQWDLDFLSQSLVGRSLDDAAGEAFDKVGKLLGFPYPGGVWVDRMARKGDPQAFPFPRALPQKTNLNFSFSGLKTAAALQIEKLRQSGDLENRTPDLCASVQEAIVDALLSKIKRAMDRYSSQSLILVGGVAANSRLRERIQNEISLPVRFPHLKYCTDNAAMIALAGYFRFQQQSFLNPLEAMKLNAQAHAPH